MSMVLEKAKIREGFTTVTPYIRVREAGLLGFLSTVFGAVETSVTNTGGDSVHREVQWHGQSLDALKGSAIRLEFLLKNADLYTFRAAGGE